MAKQRISYVPLEKMTPEMLSEMERCAREGTPRPESTAVRAHVPACFWFFAKAWHNVFRTGILDHAIKEVCRIYVSRAVVCEFCGNQRSITGQQSGVNEGQVDDLMNFEKSGQALGVAAAAHAILGRPAWRGSLRYRSAALTRRFHSRCGALASSSTAAA